MADEIGFFAVGVDGRQAGRRCATESEIGRYTAQVLTHTTALSHSVGPKALLAFKRGMLPHSVHELNRVAHLQSDAPEELGEGIDCRVRDVDDHRGAGHGSPGWHGTLRLACSGHVTSTRTA